MLPTPDELSMCLLLHSPDRMFRPLTRPLCRNRLEGSRTPHARPGAVPRNDQLLRGDSDCLVYYHWSRERRPTGTIAVGGCCCCLLPCSRARIWSRACLPSAVTMRVRVQYTTVEFDGDEDAFGVIPQRNIPNRYWC